MIDSTHAIGSGILPDSGFKFLLFIMKIILREPRGILFRQYLSHFRTLQCRNHTA